MASRAGTVIRRVVVTLVACAVVIACFFAYSNRQLIIDEIAARQFTPSAEIAQLTERIELTTDGHRVFFASEPTLDGSQHFNEQCAQVAHADGGHILGCYVAGQIHLFNVVDGRLAGIVEATAAHELLHATFARLTDADRVELVELLERSYEDLSASHPALVERMSVYADLSPTAFANELHSVLATEVRVLPDELESHYAQWLSNRTLIVDYYETSHRVFVELQDRAHVLEQQLVDMRTDIERRSATYDAAVTQFNLDVAAFSARNQNLEFSDSPEEFYALRDSLDQRRDALNTELQTLNADIAYFEELRSELQQLGELNSELMEQLNSELAPPSTAPTV